MVLGLIQYKMGDRHLGDAGHLKTSRSAAEVAALSRRFFGIWWSVVAAVAVFAWMATRGVITVSLQQVAGYLGSGILVVVGVYFAYLMLFGGHTTDEKKRLGVIFWLFLLAAVFWSGFEQAGSSLNLFASELTDRNVMGWQMPASFLQSVNPVMIILLAPLFGSLWVWLARRRANPSIPVKFGLGLLGLSAGFFVLAWGAAQATIENPVTPAWLVVTYFLHTSGELALSPVGLSSITKLSPAGRVGQMMGIWFVGAALGNLFAGLVAGQLETLPPADLFRTVALLVGAVALLALLVSPVLKKITQPVE
jgi:POT family proton-dependent oligopeptide transporter